MYSPTGLYLERSGRGVTGEHGVWGTELPSPRPHALPSRKSPSGVQGQSPGGALGVKPLEAIGTM